MPAGSSIHRVLIAPSVHNGYCGEKRTFPGATVFASQSEYKPVSRRDRGGHTSDEELKAANVRLSSAVTIKSFFTTPLSLGPVRIARVARPGHVLP